MTAEEYAACQRCTIWSADVSGTMLKGNALPNLALVNDKRQERLTQEDEKRVHAD